jgi:glutamate-1-semialdehyde 2,1-aminomutase
MKTVDNHIDLGLQPVNYTKTSDIRTSRNEFAKAKHLIPGGVNSPVRSFNQVNGDPIFIRSAHGAVIQDIDHNKYTDYCLSWGVHILGHTNKKVITQVEEAIWNGTSFGMPTPGETDLAREIVKAVPSIEMLRLVNSGTEAVMSAIRLARGYTGRTKIVKFDGGYHGHVDHLLVSSGSGVATLPSSSSNGVPEAFTSETLSIPFNDTDMVIETFAKHGKDIAAIIVEPVPANMGVILPNTEFLELLRNITTQYGALLIFDEVITGFRSEIGGAQAYFKVTPDLTTLGKIIGGGFPIGAYGGKKEIMQMVAPLGNVYQAGTLAGNPIAVTAGLAVLGELNSPLFYQLLNHKSRDFTFWLSEIVLNKGIRINAFQSMFTLFFTENEVKNYEDVKKCDTKRFEKFYKILLNLGIFFSPSQFEANFISAGHSPEDLNKTLEIVHRVLKSI